MSDPCTAGCLLGLGDRCSNRPQPWRPYAIPTVCQRIHVEGHEGYRRQPLERSAEGWEPPAAPPSGDALAPEEIIKRRRAGKRRGSLAETISPCPEPVSGRR